MLSLANILLAETFSQRDAQQLLSNVTLKATMGMLPEDLAANASSFVHFT